MSSPRICAVVVTCNRWACLQECLKGIRQQTFAVSAVFVIDNASTDGTGERLPAEFPWVKQFRLPENVGSSGGFHEGIKQAYAAGFDWLWVMDDDAVPKQDALERLVATNAFSLSDTGALCPRVIGTDGKTDLRSRPRRVDLRRFKTIQVFEGGEISDEAVEINSATFVGLLVRREAVERIGLPRSEFFIAWDDIDYMHRLCAAGFKSYFVPRAEVVHLNAGADGQAKLPFLFHHTRLPISALWKSYYTWRNRVYLVHELSSPSVLIRESCKLAAAVLLFDDHKLRRLKMLARAVRDGASGRLGAVLKPEAPQSHRTPQASRAVRGES